MSEGDALRLPDYLGHILEAIERIGSYSAGLTESAFLESKLVQDAVVRNLEVIGEAARNIERRYPEFVQAHTEVPWISAYEMRNALAHGYFRIDLAIVWRTIHANLPEMGRAVHELKRTLDGEAS
ncbi:MAG: DUF86 domain-containing protein [Proteobacteria bacterium]|nr:DUF86 domain-containing protein [Pseudomonadota bacterium]